MSTVKNNDFERMGEARVRSKAHVEGGGEKKNKRKSEREKTMK